MTRKPYKYDNIYVGDAGAGALVWIAIYKREVSIEGEIQRFYWSLVLRLPLSRLNNRAI